MMGGLADTMLILIDRAQGQPGEPVRVRLVSKLTISMMIKKNLPEVIHLQLSRSESMPSLVEWRNVIGVLPSCTILSGPAALSTDKNYLKGTLRLSDKIRLPP